MTYIYMNLSIQDWAGSANDRRSATWICFSLSFALMSWANKKQKSALQKAKYIAACDACTEAMWLQKPVFHDRPKYIEIEHYILRDKV
jgi:hypothetical protein